MRTNGRPLAAHLSWLVAASLAPTAWVAAAVTVSLYDPEWPSAMALGFGIAALIGGLAISVMLARTLQRGIAGLAVEAELLNRGRPLARVSLAVRELQALGDALAAVGARVTQAQLRRESAEALYRHAEAALDVTQRATSRGDWRWDLAGGAMDWSPAVKLLFRLAAGSMPSRERLVALAHIGDRARLAAWLAGVARGDDAPPLEFRIVRGDGDIRTIRAAAQAERDTDGAPSAVAGSFEDIGGEAAAAPGPLPRGSGSHGDAPRSAAAA